MSLKKLPQISALSAMPKSLSFDMRPEAANRWDSGVKAKTETDNVITMYDQIGESFWSEGVTAKRVAAASLTSPLAVVLTGERAKANGME